MSKHPELTVTISYELADALSQVWLPTSPSLAVEVEWTKLQKRFIKEVINHESIPDKPVV